MKTLSITVLLLLSKLAQADLAGGPESVATLQKKADLILVATIQSITDDSQGELLQLGVRSVLQGSAGSLQLTARFSPPPGMTMPKGGLLPKGWVGSTGVWFLQSGGSVYQVLPLASGFYNDKDAFLPTAGTDPMAPPPGTVNQELLWYLGQWYMSLPGPNPGDDARLFRSLDLAGQADSLAVSNILINSSVVDQVAIGLAAAIRRNSDTAIAVLATDIQTIKTSSKLYRVLDALTMYYRPDGLAALSPLQNILSLHLTIPGLDMAVGTALTRIGTKAVLPAMAELLDSQDPQAQLRAVSFFADFAMFADKNGNVSGTLVAGPFATFATQAHAPKQGSTETPAEYAQFWKAWWSDNRNAFGLATP